MKASELIQKLLEITQEEGKDLEVGINYQGGYYDGYNDITPEYENTFKDDVKVCPIDEDDGKVIIIF